MCVYVCVCAHHFWSCWPSLDFYWQRSPRTLRSAGVSRVLGASGACRGPSAPVDTDAGSNQERPRWRKVVIKGSKTQKCTNRRHICDMKNWCCCLIHEKMKVISLITQWSWVTVFFFSLFTTSHSSLYTNQVTKPILLYPAWYQWQEVLEKLSQNSLFTQPCIEKQISASELAPELFWETGVGETDQTTARRTPHEVDL